MYENNKLVVYISGPITHEPNYKRRFHNANVHLTGLGFEVLTPRALPSSMDKSALLRICDAMVRECDAIYMMPGWHDSEGAVFERNLAFKLGKMIMDPTREVANAERSE